MNDKEAIRCVLISWDEGFYKIRELIAAHKGRFHCDSFNEYHHNTIMVDVPEFEAELLEAALAKLGHGCTIVPVEDDARPEERREEYYRGRAA